MVGMPGSQHLGSRAEGRDSRAVTHAIRGEPEGGGGGAPKRTCQKAPAVLCRKAWQFGPKESRAKGEDVYLRAQVLVH